ncbi:MAG: SMC-Scp complex subunit ScpB [Planctomyces sp.]
MRGPDSFRRALTRGYEGLQSRHSADNRDQSVSASDEFRRALRRNAFRRRRGSVPGGHEQSRFLSDGSLIRSNRLARMEAVLLISDGPISARKLVQMARLIDHREVKQLIQILNEGYDRGGSAFRVESTAAGYLLMTRPQFAPWLDRLHERQSQLKLTAPSLETLTIIAYRQPVTRADVEAIRGVQSSEMIRQLIDRGLVRIAGEDDSLGRPFLYETTRQFLMMFGLQSLEELPDYSKLRKLSDAKSPARNAGDAEEDSDPDTASRTRAA